MIVLKLLQYVAIVYLKIKSSLQKCEDCILLNDNEFFILEFYKVRLQLGDSDG